MLIFIAISVIVVYYLTRHKVKNLYVKSVSFLIHVSFFLFPLSFYPGFIQYINCLHKDA